MGAQGLILEVVTNNDAAQAHAPDAVSVFQAVRAADGALAGAARARRSGRVSRLLPGWQPHRHCASRDHTARIWDAHSGAPLAILYGHGGWVITAAYSPDGTRIVTASVDKTARVWDAQTGAVLAVLNGHGDAVESAAFSPDGTRIVTASADNSARIWDAHSGAQRVVLAGHTGSVQSAAYSPDGSRIVTASADHSTRIWDAGTGKLLRTLGGHSDTVYSAAYSPDGNRIVTASADRSARVWDARSGAQISLYSPDMAAGSAARGLLTRRRARGDRLVRPYRAPLGCPHRESSGRCCRGHGGWVLTADFSPDSTRLVSASFDKTARIWRAGSTSAQLAVLRNHTRSGSIRRLLS